MNGRSRIEFETFMPALKMCIPVIRDGTVGRVGPLKPVLENMVDQVLNQTPTLPIRPFGEAKRAPTPTRFNANADLTKQSLALRAQT